MSANRETPATQYLRELVAQFPDAPALTLAKRAYSQHPERWSGLDSCRSAVRKILGVRGARLRKAIANKSLYRQPRPAGWTDVIPAAQVQLSGWEPVTIAGQQRVLILSDIHIPFHDPGSLEVALEYGLKMRPTLVVLNGDIADHYAISRYQQDPAQRDFPGEVAAVKHFLVGLRKRVGRQVRIVYKHGNHEERYEHFLRHKAPELLGLMEFSWANVFGLESAQVELIGQKRPIRLGSLNLIHGHEFSFGISSPVNPARGFFLRGKTHVMGGHFHRSSAHSEKNLDGRVVTTWSTGCLCELHPEYRPINDWNHGFSWVEVDKGGGHHVENLRIVKGKIYQ